MRYFIIRTGISYVPEARVPRSAPAEAPVNIWFAYAFWIFEASGYACLLDERSMVATCTRLCSICGATSLLWLWYRNSGTSVSTGSHLHATVPALGRKPKSHIMHQRYGVAFVAPYATCQLLPTLSRADYQH